jgi:hypothetical protein
MGSRRCRKEGEGEKGRRSEGRGARGEGAREEGESATVTQCNSVVKKIKKSKYEIKP